MKSVLDNIGRAIRQSAGDSQLVTRASNKLLNLPPPPLSLSLFLSPWLARVIQTPAGQAGLTDVITLFESFISDNRHMFTLRNLSPPAEYDLPFLPSSRFVLVFCSYGPPVGGGEPTRQLSLRHLREEMRQCQTSAGLSMSMVQSYSKRSNHMGDHRCMNIVLMDTRLSPDPPMKGLDWFSAIKFHFSSIDSFEIVW